MVDLHPSVTGGDDKFIESLRLTAKLRKLDFLEKLEDAQKKLDAVSVKLEKNPSRVQNIELIKKIIPLACAAENALNKYEQTAKILKSLTPPSYGFISEDRN